MGRSGAGVAFGAEGRFAVVLAFGPEGRFAVALAFGAEGRFAVALAFGTEGRFAVALAFGTEGRFAVARTFGTEGRFAVVLALGAEGRFSALAFGAAARADASGRTFLFAADLREAAPLRDCAGSAACAALAFFFATLATLLLAFANFRARLSTFLAARTCCFAASARAIAVVASVFSRCAAIAPFRVSVR
jgi:hypothetical protein